MSDGCGSAGCTAALHWWQAAVPCVESPTLDPNLSGSRVLSVQEDFTAWLAWMRDSYDEGAKCTWESWNREQVCRPAAACSPTF